MHGVIGNAVRPHEHSRLLTRLAEDGRVGAVVLNIDSPGGSAPGSELIARAVERLAARKPVVAFIGGLGASGGYMVAAPAHHVVAIPTALVGSIGVIAYRPVVHEALDRIGVRVRVGKAGRLKDMLSPFREATEEELRREQELLDDTYEAFVGGVARHRGIPVEQMRALATGEVYTGRESVERGLVDSLGDLEDAIDLAVARSGAQRRIKVFRPKRTLREMLLSRGAMSAFGGVEALIDGSIFDVAGRGLAASPVPQALYTGPTGGQAGVRR